MGFRVLLLYVVLLFFLVLVSSFTPNIEDERVEGDEVTSVSGGKRRVTVTGDVDCGGLCAVRCSMHSRPNVCTRACGTCCLRCKCVPPGTSGNREMCGTCYTDMKTHGNKPKCP
eukprot:TRINITY_DN5505_c0_g1_i1.p2 TRINITY_DN5505_c0_g1~~TRINITY_DN5505_c0_g1_i1.p2  ORF type:complete len:114 (-),score=2.94 TRINITY_DN5505_c0_g1_i1:163-504(-)